ncbi:uncharacterized protein LOC120529300 isoform X2 [Polypterus senegalus]|uniref:uncharacterized protein LOC120529300 isoform X2 n=1 Tax=Polypterus senegalus TaxID=55291 RepID=UPI00196305B4|nr:uncharacterized protein LOC120529300 isoform X2 [Polypterus senegalus]
MWKLLIIGFCILQVSCQERLSACLTGSGVLSSLALTVALITAMPALLCVIKGNFCAIGLSIFFINAVVPPVFMFISFLLLGICCGDAIQSSCIIFGIVHLVQIPHLGLLEFLFRNTFTAHRLGHYFGATVLPVVNAVTLIVALIFKYGKHCVPWDDLYPIIITADSIYFLLFIVSIIHGLFKEYPKCIKSLTLLYGTSR